MTRNLFLCMTALVLLAGCGSDAEKTDATDSATSTPSNAATVAFVDVQSILEKNCVQCHGAGSPKEELDLRTYESLMTGSEHGAVVVAGDPSASMLIHALRGSDGKKQMPYMLSPLPEEEIAKIEGWIQDGAKQ